MEERRCVDDLKLLRYGSRGPQVELLQLALQREGALQEAPDGIFGARTKAALQDYQGRWGLSADGVAGPRTWASLTPWLTGYRRVTLREGDTFFRLSERYGTPLRGIEAANPDLDPQNLQPGGAVTVPLPFEVVPASVSFTSLLLSLAVEGLCARYPFLAAETVGTSVLGRPLTLLRFGKGERRVFYNGAHHANEWITAPLLLLWLERLSQAYAFGGTIAGEDAAGLYSGATLHLLPLVNPDGVDLVTGELEEDSAARREALAMNGSAVGFPGNWKANIRGVDLNLQYPAGWEEARRIKFSQGFTRPGPRDYVGKAPLTEPESRAVYEYTLEHRFALTLSYHTQGRVIYWKYNGFEPAGSREIGEELAARSGYSLELTPPESAYAGYKDWFIQQFDRPGYTVEAGRGEAPLPLSQFPEIYRDNEPLLTWAMSASTNSANCK